MATQVATIGIKETTAIKLDRVTPDRQRLQRIEAQCLPGRAMIVVVGLAEIDPVAVVTTEVETTEVETTEVAQIVAMTTAVVDRRGETTIATAPGTTPGLRIKGLADKPE